MEEQQQHLRGPITLNQHLLQLVYLQAFFTAKQAQYDLYEFKLENFNEKYAFPASCI